MPAISHRSQFSPQSFPTPTISQYSHFISHSKKIPPPQNAHPQPFPTPRIPTRNAHPQPFPTPRIPNPQFPPAAIPSPQPFPPAIPTRNHPSPHPHSHSRFPPPNHFPPPKQHFPAQSFDSPTLLRSISFRVPHCPSPRRRLWTAQFWKGRAGAGAGAPGTLPLLSGCRGGQRGAQGYREPYSSAMATSPAAPSGAHHTPTVAGAGVCQETSLSAPAGRRAATASFA